MPFRMEVGLGPGDFVLDEDPAPLRKRGQSLQFPSHFYCSQTTGWNKMPLDMMVGLGPGHIVLDGAQLPSPKEAQPQFSADVRFGQTAGWTKMQLGMELGDSAQATLRSMGPSSSQKTEHSAHPISGMSIVSKRLDGSRCH